MSEGNMLRQKNKAFYAISILILILDQITKWIVSTNMYLGQALPEEGFLRLVYVLNTGSAFGLFQGFTDILIIFSFVGIALVLYLFLRRCYRPGNSKIGLNNFTHETLPLLGPSEGRKMPFSSFTHESK